MQPPRPQAHRPVPRLRAAAVVALGLVTLAAGAAPADKTTPGVEGGMHKHGVDLSDVTGERGDVEPTYRVGQTATTLTEAIPRRAQVDRIRVVSTAGFPARGTILVEGERFTYQAIDATSFQRITRKRK